MFATHRLLKKQNVLYMRRKLKKQQRAYNQWHIGADTIKQSIQSWISHAKHAGTYCLRRRVISSVAFQRGTAIGAAGGLLEQQPRQRPLCEP
jgi:hypothetical protein